MAKRVKHPRLPSGFGSIRYLGKRRTKPYAIHPPAKERDPKTGEYIRPPVLCYVSSWYVGFAVLSEYKAGRYQPGMEYDIEAEYAGLDRPETALNDFIARIIRCTPFADDLPPSWPTVANVYEQWHEWKYGEHAAKKLSAASERSTAASFSALSGFHDREMESLTLPELQTFLNGMEMSQSTVSNMLGLLKQMYRFAVPRELCTKDLGQYLVMPSTREQIHHDAFTEDHLKILWKHSDDPRAAMVLIMCYSGFRKVAYKTMEVSLDELYFRGGVKTRAGKDRIVPIHSAIVPLVRDHFDLLRQSPSKISSDMSHILTELKLPPLTPHSCRHTFSALCEHYGVNENDRKRMLGHSFGSDITNSTYSHRTLEDLRKEIEKIRVPKLKSIN